MFGESRNVFLTEKEYKQLKTDFSGLDSLIEQLSAYIQSTGKKYADHARIYDRLLELLKNADPEVKAQLRLALLT